MTITFAPSYARPARQVRTRSRWWALPVLLVAVFVTTLDFFIVNVAVPSVRADLHAGQAATQFVIAGYGLAYAAGLIIAGRLGDLYGPRRVFMIGLAVFTAASAACGLAPDVTFLVLARVTQGAAAALMGPQVLALLAVLYPGADRARAFGWYGTAVGLAGVSGQVVGGLLVTASDWRACFLVNLPIGLAALLATRWLVPEAPRRPTPARGTLDLAGAALVAAGLVAIVLPLVQGREQGWPLWTWLSLAASAPIMTAFVARQRRRSAEGREPLLDLGVFRARGFTFGLLAVALLFGGSAGLSFVLALYLQEGLGLSPLAAGAVFTALNAGFFAGSLLTKRLGGRPPIAGALALVSGFALLVLAVASGGPAQQQAGWLLPGLFLAGAGMGLVMSPLISSILAAAQEGSTGSASGVLGTVQEIGGVLGVGVTGLVAFGALDAGTDWPHAVQVGLAVLVLSALAVLALIGLHFRAARSGRTEPGQDSSPVPARTPR